MAPQEFDRYTDEYDRDLDKGLSLSGEHKDYFASGRAAWLARRVFGLGERPRTILDFGCGTGSGVPFLLSQFEATSLLGVDVSARSIEVARSTHTSSRARFCVLDRFQPAGDIDLAFCNGVFHHIDVADRAGALDVISRSLRPGGVFGFWENNPWNPGTRLVMSRIPFDRDAAMVWPAEARRLLSHSGFEVLGTDFLFVFPRVLAWARRAEYALSRLPIGAQYLILGRKK